MLDVPARLILSDVLAQVEQEIGRIPERLVANDTRDEAAVALRQTHVVLVRDVMDQLHRIAERLLAPFALVHIAAGVEDHMLGQI